jgi:hypothetical protein
MKTGVQHKPALLPQGLQAAVFKCGSAPGVP